MTFELIPPELLDYATATELAEYERMLAAELADLSGLDDDGPALIGDIDPENLPRNATELAAALTRGREAQRPHLELIERTLASAAETGRQRIILNVGPRYGKTRKVRWCILQRLREDPDCRVIYGSYSKPLAHEQTRWIRDQIESHDLGVTVRQDTRAADRWYLEGYEGGMLAAGVGTGITGFGANLLVVDDVIADDVQAMSATWRERGWRWFTQTAFDRLEPNASVVIIMTRWHEDDLAGRLLREQPGVWTHIRVPTIAEPEDLLGRAEGELLWPERFDAQAVAEQRMTLGAHGFASRHQQSPSSEAGDVWQRQWWRRFATPIWHTDTDGSMRVDDGWTLTQSWDMAFKDTKASDYVVGEVWASRGAQTRLIDVVRGRWDFTNTLAVFRRTCTKWPQSLTKLVEDKANGPAVISALRDEIPGIVAVNPGQDSKRSRAVAVSGPIEAGNVMLPEKSIALYDVDAFIEETAAFDTGAHDDQVDAASQHLKRWAAGAGKASLSGAQNVQEQVAPASPSAPARGRVTTTLPPERTFGR